MLEPNFSESQLQQATNAAFIQRIFLKNGTWAFPHVMSLFDEFGLGWDTAFHLGWLPYIPEPDHEGCNFFLQYKLSNQLTSAGAKEWSHWGEEYFRFKIPHRTRDATGKYFDDYHQWDRLKELAAKSYPTYYATNATLSKDVLIAAMNAGTLLDNIPLLDVRTIANKHKHVTFTPKSHGFRLHSEVEIGDRFIFSNMLTLLTQQPQLTLTASNERLRNELKELRTNDSAWNNDLSQIDSFFSGNTKNLAHHWFQHLALASFLRKHTGAYLLWCPKGA